VGAGIYATVGDAVEAFVSYRPDHHEPNAASRDVYDDAYKLYRDVYASLKPVFSSG
jgi:sugar (pentulose or hexulose) kinase